MNSWAFSYKKGITVKWRPFDIFMVNLPILYCVAKNVFWVCKNTFLLHFIKHYSTSSRQQEQYLKLVSTNCTVKSVLTSVKTVLTSVNTVLAGVNTVLANVKQILITVTYILK